MERLDALPPIERRWNTIKCPILVIFIRFTHYDDQYSAKAALRVPLLDGFKERGTYIFKFHIYFFNNHKSQHNRYSTVLQGKIEQGTLERGSSHIILPYRVIYSQNSVWFFLFWIEKFCFFVFVDSCRCDCSLLW